jgi:hypothetical protein
MDVSMGMSRWQRRKVSVMKYVYDVQYGVSE